MITVVVVILAVAACGGSPAAAPVAVVRSFAAGTAPTQVFAVGMGTRSAACAGGLTMDLYYPAVKKAAGAAYLPGRWPVVLFSHGLQLRPDDYDALLRRWAAAGFVIVAPIYPHTARDLPDLNTHYMHQPADASCVLDSVLADPQLRDHLDPARIAAAGHSAGAYTTVGLFTRARDPRLTAAVILAGGADSFVYTGTSAPMLFVHGDADPVVVYSRGQAAYRADPWPKAFLTLPGEGHLDPYLNSYDPAFETVVATSLDFLRWTLYGDRSAQQRLPLDAGAATLVQAW